MFLSIKTGISPKISGRKAFLIIECQFVTCRKKSKTFCQLNSTFGAVSLVTLLQCFSLYKQESTDLSLKQSKQHTNARFKLVSYLTKKLKTFKFRDLGKQQVSRLNLWSMILTPDQVSVRQ